VPSTNWHVASTMVTPDRISWAIKTMATYKSPGIDGIYPILLQKGLQHLLDPLCAIYRASLALGYIPQIWRASRVTFMPKPGKTDYTIAKSYRPISLTPFLPKGLEKLVDRYLRSGPVVSVPIHPRQHAFQAGKSTESALHQLVGRIEKALDSREYSLGVFFDIEGAFDNTSCKSIRLALDEWKVHRYIRNWITTMLAHQTILAITETFSISAIASCGLRGGLSPIL